MVKYIVAFLFIINSFAYAEDVFKYPAKDIKAVEKIVKNPEKITGDFNQVKTLKELGISLESSGVFMLNKEEGILWQNEKPFKSAAILTSKGMCSKNGDKIVRISTENRTVREMLSVFNSIFTQDFETLKRYFDIYFKETKSGYILGMRSKNANVSDIMKEMTVSGSKYVSEINITSANGDVTVINFTNIKEGAEKIECSK